MSQAYEREQQNNSRLDELASKVSALRGVTIDIYDNARDQHVIDSTVRSPDTYTRTRLTSHSVERHLLLLRHITQRLRHTPHTHGFIGEQSRHSEVGGDNNRGGGDVVLDLAFDFLRKSGLHEDGS